MKEHYLSIVLSEDGEPLVKEIGQKNFLDLRDVADQFKSQFDFIEGMVFLNLDDKSNSFKMKQDSYNNNSIRKSFVLEEYRFPQQVIKNASSANEIFDNLVFAIYEDYWIENHWRIKCSNTCLLS